ncbi:MAG: alpha/beta hydrolase [Patulibacter minatonensis]
MPHAHLAPTTAVHYEVLAPGPAGDTAAPDLVLVHGTGGSAATHWAHLADGLAGIGAGRRVLAVNYSGSGETVDDGGPLTLDGLVAQVRGAVADAGDRPFDLVGFSLGAVVAAGLAARDAAGLRRLVLLSGWVRPDSRTALQFGLWRRLHEGDRRALAQLLALTGFSAAYLAARPARALERAVEHTLATLAPGFVRQCALDEVVDVSADLMRIARPTLVLGATEDAMVPVAQARALAAGIPEAQYGELRSGHLSIFEAPDELLTTIGAFLEA